MKVNRYGDSRLGISLCWQTGIIEVQFGELCAADPEAGSVSGSFASNWESRAFCERESPFLATTENTCLI
jgi:hypothetical protein